MIVYTCQQVKTPVIASTTCFYIVIRNSQVTIDRCLVVHRKYRSIVDYSGIYYRLKTQHMISTICQNAIVDF